MSKILDVPTFAQTSSDTCWHAASVMIWEYWQRVTGRQGPMNTLGDVWTANQPTNPAQWATLAKKVGLKNIPGRPFIITSKVLEDYLTQYGPIWCAGTWFGPGHAIVLTGVNGKDIYLNDPDGGVKKTKDISWFNIKLFHSVEGSMMYKDPLAY